MSYRCKKAIFFWGFVWNKGFSLGWLFLLKKHESLNQNKRSKNQLWVWCHCNLCTLSGLCLFCNLNNLKSPFPGIFDEFLFVCPSSLPLSSKSVSSSHHQTNTHHVGVLNSPNQISLKSILNPGQDWCEMQICD